MLVVLAACGAPKGPPEGFTGGGGDRWTLPLVGPLEDGLLVTPVLIDGNGPFLFALDPDANVSLVDEQLVKDAKLVASKGPPRVDESGTEQPRFYAEARALEVGALIIERITATIVRTNALDVNGRRIHGVLGRDVLAESLAFGFDRDQGLAYLTTASAFEPPPGAIAIPYTPLAPTGAAQVKPVERRIVKATVSGQPLALHLDLGAIASQLREARWEPLQLPASEGAAITLDEVGTRRRVSRIAPAEVALDRTTARVVFVPYEEQRFAAHAVDGTLGLDFFRAFDTHVDWTAKTFYVTPRQEVPFATRVARWEMGAFGKCKQPGCVTVRLIDPTVGKQLDPAKPHPGLVLSITREELAGGMDLEVVLEAAGKPALPRILVNLSPSADRVLAHLKPEWVGAQLTVVDASPFARTCPGAEGCVDLLAR